MDPAQIPLRDWHYPEPIAWWPPAPGWWIVLGSLVFFLIGVLWWRWYQSRPNVKKIAKAELESLRLDSNLSALDRVIQLSMLMRRIALSVYPRTEAAKLTGTEWLRLLDRSLADRPFSEGPGRILVDAPYQKNAEYDQDAIFALCDRWIESLPEKHKQSTKTASSPV